MHEPSCRRFELMLRFDSNEWCSMYQTGFKQAIFNGKVPTNHHRQTTVNILAELIFSVSVFACQTSVRPLRSVKAALRADAEHHGRDGAEAARLWEASKKPKATASRGETCRTEQRSNLDKKNRGVHTDCEQGTNRKEMKEMKGMKGIKEMRFESWRFDFCFIFLNASSNSENLRYLCSSSQQRSCEASGKCHF